METINKELPKTIGINNVEKGIYEFDVDILHTGVEGFGGTYFMSHQAMTTGKQKLYLRIGTTCFQQLMPMHHVPEFVLGDFTRVWMEGDTVKGTVIIHPCHYALFDKIVEALNGVLLLGVCSIVVHNGHGRNSVRVIEKFLGAQLLDPIGCSLMEVPSTADHEIHDIGLKAMPGTASYIKFCADSIASEPFVPKVKEEVPPPPADGEAKPYKTHDGVVIADVHVKGLDEKIAVLATPDPIESLCLDKEIKLEVEDGA